MGRPRKIDPDEVRRLHARGLCGTEIARRLGATQQAVWYWCRRLGLPLRPGGGALPSAAGRRRARHMARLYEAGHDMPAIARRYGVSKQRVHQILAARAADES